MLKSITTIILAVILGGCAVFDGARQLPMNKIRVGMEKSVVMNMLGNPISVNNVNMKGTNVELYGYVDVRQIWLTGNILIGGTYRIYENYYGLAFVNNKLVEVRKIKKK